MKPSDKALWANLSADLQHKIEHALGYEKLYRNHYCAPQGGVDAVHWLMLAGIGLARLGRSDDGLETWHVTEEGIAMYKTVRGIA